MPLINQVVLECDIKGEDNIKMELHAKSFVTGKFVTVLELVGSEDEWESFIQRIRKQLSLKRN